LICAAVKWALTKHLLFAKRAVDTAEPGGSTVVRCEFRRKHGRAEWDAFDRYFRECVEQIAAFAAGHFTHRQLGAARAVTRFDRLLAVAP